jgi:glycosyltransferase involved in cell wall biosynthesis
MATCAVIPVYNQPATIAAVVADLRAYNLPVVLVDDGSNAACAAVLAAIAAGDAEVHLLRLPRNSGKGAAVVAGARAALARGFSHMLQIDADGQHDTNAVPRALQEVQRHPEALVIGVPVFDASIPRARLYGRMLTHGLVWIQTLSLAIRDAMCGFRIYPLAPFVALADRHGIAKRMGFDIDVAVRLVWSNMAVKRVPVAVHYPEDGVSHYDFWGDNVRIAALHLRLLGGMLIRLPCLLRQRLSFVRHQ